MRNFGLILENLDGLPPQTPVFRGVPHTLALPTSIKVDPTGADSQTRDDATHSTVAEATGRPTARPGTARCARSRSALSSSTSRRL
jgi:hypothetical protein